jgi:hypothetical protein
MTLLDEERFPLSQKTKLGIHRSAKTLERWHKKGMKVRGKRKRQIVKLEALYEGVQLVTSREAIKRFLAALNGTKQPA